MHPVLGHVHHEVRKNSPSALRTHLPSLRRRLHLVLAKELLRLDSDRHVLHKSWDSTQSRFSKKFITGGLMRANANVSRLTLYHRNMARLPSVEGVTILRVKTIPTSP